MAHRTHFGGLPAEFSKYDNSKIVIVPVPYDGTSTWGKGADRGPEVIMEASSHMELYDIETDTEAYRHGIFTDVPVDEKSSAENMYKAVKQRISDHLGNDKFVITLGGEHSISIGAIEAHVDRFKNVSVLQLDAHADLREEYEGTKYNHACVMARAREMCPIVQVGIRSMDISEKDNCDNKRIFFAEKLVDNKGWIDMVVSKLGDNVYITIDLDVFDISIMPATGTPEPGGLSWYDVLSLLKMVIKKRKVVGFDVVEMCPNATSKPSDFLAAKLIYKLMSYVFAG